MKNRQDNDEINFAIMCALLKQGRHIDITASIILIFTVLQLLFSVTSFTPPNPIWLSGLFCLLFWLIQKYYAIRVSIDSILFSFLTKNHTQTDDYVNSLDASLINLGLMKNKNQRTINARQKGAFNLLKKQLTAFILQVIAWLVYLMGMIVIAH